MKLTPALLLQIAAGAASLTLAGCQHASEATPERTPAPIVQPADPAPQPSAGRTLPAPPKPEQPDIQTPEPEPKPELIKTETVKSIKVSKDPCLACGMG